MTAHQEEQTVPGPRHKSAHTAWPGYLRIKQDRGRENFSLRNWPSIKHEIPRSFWLGDGDTFFVITRNPDAHQTEGRFLRANGELLEVQALDPAVLMPFDDEPFTGVDRSCQPPVINRSIKGAGSMLDTWHDIRFEQRKSLRRLATYRPVGTPYKSEGAVLCDVEESWIAMNASTQQ